MKKTLKKGDKIIYRPFFGQDLPVINTVREMTRTKEPREKYGILTHRVYFSEIRDNKVCITLENGRWLYSEQIDISDTQKLWELEALPTEDLPTELENSYALVRYIQQRIEEDKYEKELG